MQQNNEFVIDVHGLSKSFEGKIAVNQLSLQVKRGEIYGFLGPNGSGKTTSIRMLCGLLTPDSGSGTCLGFDIAQQSAEIKRQVGYMTQRFSLYEDLSIRENLDFTARVYGMKNRREVVEKSLERLGLTERKNQLAAGSSVLRWLPACCMNHVCCYWTNPPPELTPKRAATSGMRYTPLPQMELPYW